MAIRVLITVCACAIAAFSTGANADPTTRPTDAAVFTTESAYALLKESDAFAESGVGYAGMLPKTLAALGYLLEQDNAPDLLERLLEEATPAGQLYATAGLYQVNHVAFGKAVERLRGSDTRVIHFSGCMRYETTVGDLVGDSKLPAADAQDGKNIDQDAKYDTASGRMAQIAINSAARAIEQERASQRGGSLGGAVVVN